MKTAEEFRKRLIELGACKEAIEWAEGRTASEAWEQCDRGDWLLWWAQKEGVDLRQLTLAKARCAKLVIHLMENESSIKAVEAAESYGLGLIESEELNAAYAAAYTATAAAAAAAAAYAATYAAAYTAAAAADAAYTAAYTATAAAAAAANLARNEILKKCADIVRQNIKPEFL